MSKENQTVPKPLGRTLLSLRDGRGPDVYAISIAPDLQEYDAKDIGSQFGIPEKDVRSVLNSMEEFFCQELEKAYKRIRENSLRKAIKKQCAGKKPQAAGKLKSLGVFLVSKRTPIETRQITHRDEIIQKVIAANRKISEFNLNEMVAAKKEGRKAMRKSYTEENVAEEIEDFKGKYDTKRLLTKALAKAGLSWKEVKGRLDQQIIPNDVFNRGLQKRRERRP